MSWVRVTTIWVMAVVVLPTGPPSPMFSPAAVQWMPAAVSRSPMAGSPEHWWDSPQPPAISRLCAEEVASRPEVTVRAGRPADERAALIIASTCAAGVPSPADVAGVLAEALGEALAETEGDAAGFDAVWLGDGDAGVVGRAARGAARTFGAAGGTVAVLRSMGPCSAQTAAGAGPQASAVCSAVTAPREVGEAVEFAGRARERPRAIR